MTAKFIAVDGETIAYDDTGSGPAVLLGHSHMCDRTMWRFVEPELGLDYRVINVEVRGHAQSTARKRISLKDLAGDWLAILDKESIEKVVICGLSIGGMTGIEFASRFPQRVPALILMDTTARPEPWMTRIHYRFGAEVNRRLGFGKFAESMVRNILFGKTTLTGQPALVETEIRRIRALDHAQNYYAMRALIERPDLRDKLAQIHCPALLIVGEEDTRMPVLLHEEMAAQLPNARLHVIPQAGHLSALEAPAKVSKLIRDFLAEVAPVRGA